MLYLCAVFDNKQKYQRLRHYFCMNNATVYDSTFRNAFTGSAVRLSVFDRR